MIFKFSKKTNSLVQIRLSHEYSLRLNFNPQNSLFEAIYRNNIIPHPQTGTLIAKVHHGPREWGYSFGEVVMIPWKVYKLVIETLKYKSILESLISKCQIEKKEKWLGKGRCLCIVYEFLIGSGLRKMFLIIHSSNSL